MCNTVHGLCGDSYFFLSYAYVLAGASDGPESPALSADRADDSEQCEGLRRRVEDLRRAGVSHDLVLAVEVFGPGFAGPTP